MVSIFGVEQGGSKIHIYSICKMSLEQTTKRLNVFESLANCAGPKCALHRVTYHCWHHIGEQWPKPNE